jgi:hypothetical protein
MRRKRCGPSFGVCARNQGDEASLELRKIYEGVPNPESERRGMVRIIDESGEDHLLPDGFFLSIALSPVIRRDLIHERATTR